MPMFRWDDSYSVSVKQFDAQHKQLVALLNQMKEAVAAGHSQQTLGGLLAEIREHTAAHFAAEEALMRQTEFSDLNAHAREHQELTARLDAFVAKHKKGEATIDINLLMSLRNWLVLHIAESDKRYSAHLNNCGID